MTNRIHIWLAEEFVTVFLITCISIAVSFAQTQPAAQNRPIENTNKPRIASTESLQEKDQIVLQLVDSAERPIAYAKAGTSLLIQNDKAKHCEVSMLLRSQENNISDERGEIKLTREKLFSPSWPADKKTALYVLHENRELGAFCEISWDSQQKEIHMTLEPTCHVYGKLSSAGLQDIGHPLTWTNVDLQWKEFECSHFSENQNCEFFVPAGKYRLTATGGGKNISADVTQKTLTIEVKEGQSELDIGTIDLAPTKLATLIGRPAPELGPIQAWKNGPAVKLSELKGKAVLLYFGGETPSTDVDLPRCVDLHQEFGNKGLVIIAIYNSASLEDLEDRWLEIHEKFGGLANVPFRVAIDKSEPSYYDDTNELRWGTTYASYDIPPFPTAILIDPQGKIFRQINLFQEKQIIQKMLGIQPNTAWQERFEAAYRLEDGQILKRIAPPFIPERREYYLTEESGQASSIYRSPDIFVFNWDGKLNKRAVAFARKLNLRTTLGGVLGLKIYEYEGPEELLNIDLPGDWTIRNDLSQEEKLKALEQLLAEELSQNIRFEKRTVERQVIVATGRYRFHPVPGAFSHDSVHFYLDELSPGGGGGHDDSVAELLQTIGNHVNMYVADHTESSEETSVSFRFHRSSRFLRQMENSPEKTEKLKAFLANISKQTELQFEFKKQPVDIWFVTEVKED